MDIKRIVSAAAAAVCLLGFVGCSDEKSSSSESSLTYDEKGVSDLIVPEEGSEEYELGSYHISPNGIKLYYDEDELQDIALAVENYFLSFQDKDFERYKSCLAFDYAERYEAYLNKDFNYGLKESFDLQCSYIGETMLREITGEYDVSEITDHTGDFKITRIRVEEPYVDADTKDDVSGFFGTLDEIFDMDYYGYVKEKADDLKYVLFFIIAEGDDGEEHRIVSEMGIVFAEKDGKYYTFG